MTHVERLVVSFKSGLSSAATNQFVRAIALIQSGRLGKIQRATCSIGGAPGQVHRYQFADVPQTLDGIFGSAPSKNASSDSYPATMAKPRVVTLSLRVIVGGYEYSGGKLTDWGAHHVDIATWGLGKTETGPVSIDPVDGKTPG